jgi:hypothetical protein
MSVEVAIFSEIQVIHYRIAVVQINHSQTERAGMAMMLATNGRIKAHAYRLRLLYLAWAFPIPGAARTKYTDEFQSPPKKHNRSQPDHLGVRGLKDQGP